MGKISEFLELYNGKHTATVYRSGLFVFLDSMYGKQRQNRNATGEERERYEQLMSRYLSDNRDHVNDLMKFAADMGDKPPLTARPYLSAIKEFLGYNGIELTQRDARRIRTVSPKETPGQ